MSKERFSDYNIVEYVPNRIRNWHNYDSVPNNSRYEARTTQPSMTVPDQTLPLRTLIERYTRGQSVPVIQQDYNDDPMWDGVENLSKLELLDRAMEVGESIREFQKPKPKPEPAPAPPAPPVPSAPAPKPGEINHPDTLT